jgi:hypothetical protein
MRRLVKIGFSYHTLAVRSGRGRMSTESRWAVRLMTRPYIHSDVFQGEPHFLSIVNIFSNS